jgi:CRP-like cAMP-binding protein
MTRREAKAGQTLWHKGDKATEMLYVQSGQLNLLEYDESIGTGSTVGEIGLLAPTTGARAPSCAPPTARCKACRPKAWPSFTSRTPSSATT